MMFHIPKETYFSTIPAFKIFDSKSYRLDLYNFTVKSNSRLPFFINLEIFVIESILQYEKIIFDQSHCIENETLYHL